MTSDRPCSSPWSPGGLAVPRWSPETMLQGGRGQAQDTICFKLTRSYAVHARAHLSQQPFGSWPWPGDRRTQSWGWRRTARGVWACGSRVQSTLVRCTLVRCTTRWVTNVIRWRLGYRYKPAWIPVQAGLNTGTSRLGYRYKFGHAQIETAEGVADSGAPRWKVLKALRVSLGPRKAADSRPPGRKVYESPNGLKDSCNGHGNVAPTHESNRMRTQTHHAGSSGQPQTCPQLKSARGCRSTN